MSKILYKYVFQENILDENGFVKEEHCTHLPHAEQIIEAAEKSFNDTHLETFFDGVLKDNIVSCTMRCCESALGELYGIISVVGKQGFRFSEKRRNAVYDQLDAQFSDGWGEGFFGYGNIMKSGITKFIVE